MKQVDRCDLFQRARLIRRRARILPSFAVRYHARVINYLTRVHYYFANVLKTEGGGAEGGGRASPRIVSGQLPEFEYRAR